nr:hypothetical protein [Salinibacter grassmerensis]
MNWHSGAEAHFHLFGVRAQTVIFWCAFDHERGALLNHSGAPGRQGTAFRRFKADVFLDPLLAAVQENDKRRLRVEQIGGDPGHPVEGFFEPALTYIVSVKDLQLLLRPIHPKNRRLHALL